MMVVFLVTLIGVMDFAQVLFVHQSMVERVRNSVRWGVVRQYDAQAVRNMVLYNQPVAPQGIYQGFLGLNAANVSVARSGDGTESDRMTVSIVNYQYRFLTPFLAKTFTNNMAVVETLPVEYRP